MTIYPGSIDTNTSLPLVIDDVTPVTAITVNRLRETLIAVETELGTDPSGGYSDVAARLTALEASGGAAHATTHEDGGSDELTIQNLGSGAAAANKVVVTDGAGGLTLQDYISGSGTDNHIVRWNGTGALQDSGLIITDGDDLQGVGDVTFNSTETSITIQGGYPTSDDIAGQDMWIQAGDSSTQTGSTERKGGDVTILGGSGPFGGAIAFKIGDGGDVDIGGGYGGFNTDSGDGGNGGDVNIDGGDYGFGGTGADGVYGTVNIGTGAGFRGVSAVNIFANGRSLGDGPVNIGTQDTANVYIGASGTPTTIYSATTTIADPGANSYLDFASSEYVIGRTRYIRTVSPITAGYRGDSLTIEAGDGAAGGASGGQGGNAGFYSGDGAEAATAGNTSSPGGTLTIRSGAGGWGNTSGGKPHWGGPIDIRAGDGGRIQAGSAVNVTYSKGGSISILAGDGCLSLETTVAATAGGALIMEGGEGGLGYNATGDGGPGGTTTVQGGRAGQAAGSGNDGAGGSVQIDAGRNYSGAQGTVDLGYTDRWGASWASAIRCFVPTTIYNSLFIGSTTTSENFLDIEDGTGAAVSAAGDVRIRNNSGKLEVSEDGYAYAPLGYVDTGAAKTGAYSADIGELVKVDPSGGGFAVTLPTAIGYDNQGITVKNVTNSTNAVTFNTTGGQTIDGAASGTDQIDTAYETVTFISDGSNWMRFPAA